MKTLLPLLRESDIQRTILDYVVARQHFVWRNNTGMHRSHYNGKERFIRFGKAGSADIVGVQRGTGRFIAIEVKRPGAKPTPDQRDFLERVKTEGGIAVVATSVEDVINAGL